MAETKIHGLDSDPFSELVKPAASADPAVHLYQDYVDWANSDPEKRADTV